MYMNVNETTVANKPNSKTKVRCMYYYFGKYLFITKLNPDRWLLR